MRRIESIEDEMKDRATYELEPGRRVTLCGSDLRELGLAECLKRVGVDLGDPAKRVPVFQSGEQVGTVPGDFDPLFIKSTSFMYEARPGDFVLDNDTWIANKMLGFGDLGAIRGFVFKPPFSSHGRAAQGIVSRQGHDREAGRGERSE